MRESCQLTIVRCEDRDVLVVVLVAIYQVVNKAGDHFDFEGVRTARRIINIHVISVFWCVVI